MVSHSIATIAPETERLPLPLIYSGGKKKKRITMEHDISSSQPDWDNQEIKGSNAGVLWICHKLRTAIANSEGSDPELRQ